MWVSHFSDYIRRLLRVNFPWRNCNLLGLLHTFPGFFLFAMHVYNEQKFLVRFSWFIVMYPVLWTQLSQQSHRSVYLHVRVILNKNIIFNNKIFWGIISFPFSNYHHTCPLHSTNQIHHRGCCCRYVLSNNFMSRTVVIEDLPSSALEYGLFVANTMFKQRPPPPIYLEISSW